MSAFSWPVRVYWEDTDGGGVVFYANYLRYLERARTEWLRSLGYSQQALAQDPGIVFTVVGLTIEYRRPARLDDRLAVTCEPRLDGAATVRFAQRIFREREDADSAEASERRSEDLLVEADVRVACVDAKTFRPRRLPAFIVNSIHIRA